MSALVRDLEGSPAVAAPSRITRLGFSPDAAAQSCLQVQGSDEDDEDGESTVENHETQPVHELSPLAALPRL